MTSSPGIVVASTACMNAMLAPAVTMTRLPVPISIRLSARSFTLMRSSSTGRPLPSWYSCVEGRASAARTASTTASGGP